MLFVRCRRYDVILYLFLEVYLDVYTVSNYDISIEVADEECSKIPYVGKLCCSPSLWFVVVSTMDIVRVFRSRGNFLEIGTEFLVVRKIVVSESCLVVDWVRTMAFSFWRLMAYLSLMSAVTGTSNYPRFKSEPCLVETMKNLFILVSNFLFDDIVIVGTSGDKCRNSNWRIRNLFGCYDVILFLSGVSRTERNNVSIVRPCIRCRRVVSLSLDNT